MAVLRWPLLALAVATLSGCSAPGNGLYAPLRQTPTAWNGADHPARVRTEGQVIRSARFLHPKTEAIVGSIGYKSPDPALKPYSKEWFAQQEAIDREADAALVKKMTICRGCQSPPKESDLVAQPRTNSAQSHRKKTRRPGALALVGLPLSGRCVCRAACSYSGRGTGCCARHTTGRSHTGRRYAAARIYRPGDGPTWRGSA
jgi:hypothetical protein